MKTKTIPDGWFIYGISLKPDENPGPYEDEPALACPECNRDYSHIREVHTETYLPYDKPYEGTVPRTVTPPRNRCLVITIDGECPHAWEIRIQQDRGKNFVSMRMVPPLEPSEDIGPI